MKFPKSAKIEIIKRKKISWINIENPADKEFKWLQDEVGVHHLDIEDVASPVQLPKIDEYTDYLYIILNLPRFSRSQQRTFSQKLDIFISQDFIITVSQGDIKTLNLIFDQINQPAEKREIFFSQGTGYLLYKIITALMDYQLPMLRKIQEKMDKVEEDFFEKEINHDTLSEIAYIKQDIISFKKITKPLRGVISDIDEKHKRFIPENLEVYYDDIYDKIEKIWDQLENYQDVIESIEGTVESFFSHRTNDVIRMLTIFSVIMLPLTVITGFYGMNIALPGAERNFTFAAIILLMVCLAGGMLVYFKKRKWL